MASRVPVSLPSMPVTSTRSYLIPSQQPTHTPGYLEALIQPNTEPVYSDIVSIDETGLHTEDGNFHEVDLIVCATGFDMAWTPHFELRGVDDARIQDAWSPVPNCYLGIAAPGFPNYWVMNGPRGNLCNGTVSRCGSGWSTAPLAPKLTGDQRSSHVSKHSSTM